jgi:hypothetical protein
MTDLTKLNLDDLLKMKKSMEKIIEVKKSINPQDLIIIKNIECLEELLKDIIDQIEIKLLNNKF